MSFRIYCWEIIKKAIGTPWIVADTIASILGLVGAVLTYLIPQLTSYVQLASWIVPIALFAPLVLVRFALAPYWLLLDERNSSEETRKRLGLIDASKPNIVLHSIRSAQLYKDAKVVDGKRPIFRIVQVWFRNSPVVPTEQSMAKSISAIVEFRNKANELGPLKAYGVWSIDNPPDFVGSGTYASTVDMPPGNLPLKLNIALKYTGEASAYRVSLESFTRDPDGRDLSHEIPPGSYEVIVRLTGIGVDQNFRFDLTNSGQETDIDLQGQ